MYSEVFPSRLKLAREANFMTQIDVAKLLQIDKSTIANYETGKREPNFELLVKISLLFKVTTDWLLGASTEGGIEIHDPERLREDRERELILKKLEKEARFARRLEKKCIPSNQAAQPYGDNKRIEREAIRAQKLVAN